MNLTLKPRSDYSQDHLASWQRHGFELRLIQGGSLYLFRTFMNFTFVVRQASNLEQPLDPAAQYKLQFKPRDGGRLSAEVHTLNGLTELVLDVRRWHMLLNASTLSPSTPCSPRLIAMTAQAVHAC